MTTKTRELVGHVPLRDEAKGQDPICLACGYAPSDGRFSCEPCGFQGEARRLVAEGWKAMPAQDEPFVPLIPRGSRWRTWAMAAVGALVVWFLLAYVMNGLTA